MPTLFLDFDGVLHPADARPEEFFCHLPALETLLREFGKVDVVLSTLWREQHPLEALAAHFSPDIAARIVGATPQLPGLSLECGQRQREIEAWMAANRPGEVWLALDDRLEYFDHDCPNLLWVTRTHLDAPGLNNKQLQQLRILLTALAKESR